MLFSEQPGTRDDEGHRVDWLAWVGMLRWLIALFALILIGWPHPAWGALAQVERSPLTLPLLQERLKAPIASEGDRLIDLRRLVIDLRPENAEFRDQFYRLVQTQLRSQSSLGIDLSYSVVLGEMQLGDLGVRAPLYGQSLAPLLTPPQQEQLQRDRRRLAQLSQLSRSLLIQAQPATLQLALFQGPLVFVQTRFEGGLNSSNIFFVNRIEAQGASFNQEADWSESRFGRDANFDGASFKQTVRFRNTIFFERSRFSQGQFQGSATFQGSEFRATASFGQAMFQQDANFSRVQWQGNADFSQTRWYGTALFNAGNFAQALYLTDAVFDHLLSFRQAQFSHPTNLRGSTISDQADFGDAIFGASAYLNLSGLQFNAEKARLLGSPGQLGRVLSVPTLQGNETLLRNLIRNFRVQEQILDANQLEYTREKLRLTDLQHQLTGINLNTVSLERMQRLGFTPEQAQAIATVREQHLFRSVPDLLKLNPIDLATYVRVKDHVFARGSRSLLDRLGDVLHWAGLALLLLLTRYGTSFWLVFGVGLVAIAYFGVVFWLVDRVRRIHPKPVLPSPDEVVWMLGGSGAIALIGISAIFRTAEHPLLTFACLGILAIPVPSVLLWQIYQRGRYHDLMEVSYFVEDGSLRQLRLLIGRLPNIPRYPFFRERYAPILWDRRWNWLNYLDFSLNNLLKFGFNDIRLRDEHMPGLITALAWYQWTLGLLYLAVLLWTLSRTIPGLNLLIYFK